MQDPHDNRPIRHRYLGAFNIKKHKRKPEKVADEDI